MTRELTLQSPEMAIDTEYAVAEEVVEEIVEPRAFDVVGEIGDEEVVEVGGVSGANAAREVEEVVDLESGCWRLREHVGDPIVETVAVAEETREVSNYRVRLWSRVFARRSLFLTAENGEEDEGKETKG